MKLIYVAAPYTAKTMWGIHENIRVAERWGLAIMNCGANAWPLVPQANTGLLHGMCSEADAYEGTLELMRRCDGVIVAARHGWDGNISRGVYAEIAEARRLELPVLIAEEHRLTDPMHGLAAIRSWIDAIPHRVVQREPSKPGMKTEGATCTACGTSFVKRAGMLLWPYETCQACTQDGEPKLVKP